LGTIAWISAASIAGGVLSVLLAAVVAFSARASWIPVLVSFAIGALLGAAFLELLPHAFANAGDVRGVAATVLGGILGFFVLEKLVLWRHCHVEDCEAHDHHSEPNDHGRSGLLILVGDSFHNFVDGILVAAAFLESTELGIVTAAAVIAHEIPQEMGDFVILLHSGFSKAKALWLNLLSSLAMLVGALLGYLALHAMSQWVNTMLAIAAASMIYIAVADLIPGLHKRPELRSTLHQVVLIGLGVAAIWAVGELTGRGH
jgi:zinc and cadmium transporter